MNRPTEDQKTLQAHRLQWLNPNEHYLKRVKESSRETPSIQINLIFRE